MRVNIVISERFGTSRLIAENVMVLKLLLECSSYLEPLSRTPVSTLTTAASPDSKFSKLNKLSLRNSYHSFPSLFSPRLASQLTHPAPLFCLTDFGRL